MTTTPAPPATWAPLEQALRQRRPVRISYHRRQRLISPHALGWKNHRPMLLAYQSEGLTSTEALSDPRKRWRCLYVDEIDYAAAADGTTSWQTAGNYDASRPFPSTVDVVIAISPGDPPHGS
jgi:predicted DNA-binding transcriptional regulator YafY